MHVPRQSDRAFGLIFGIMLTTFATVVWLVFDVLIDWLYGLSAVFIVLALIQPRLLLPLNRLWGSFAGRLGLFNNFVLLSIFYYLFIFPLGVVFKLFGRDPMHRRLSTNASTYWRPVERRAEEDNYPDMF